MKKTEKIAVSKIELNNGQIPGLPANPRMWTYAELDNLCKSIEETPELLEARGLIVTPHDGKYIVLGGNMRFVAVRTMGMKEINATVMPEDTPIKKLKEIVMKDNSSFGNWDWKKLDTEWKSEAKSEWGLPIPVEESHEPAKVSVPSSKEEVVMEVAFLPDELVFVTQRLLKLGENVSEGLLNLLGYVPES